MLKDKIMPKWTNGGHEFDELGEKFIKNKNFLLIGNEDECEKIKKKLEFLGVDVKISGNIPSYESEKKLPFSLNKLLFKSKLKNFLENIAKNRTIIRTGVNYDNYTEKWITKISKQNNLTIYRVFEFFEKYLPIYAVYVKDIVYSPHNSFICTTVCNLNCKNCLNFTPYNKNKRHYDINKLKENVDVFFNAIDRVGLFHISGGEPQLYPNIIELIEYIYLNYKDKIETLGMVTNAFVVPTDELCKTLKRCKVQVGIDDYRKACPNFSSNFEKCLEKFKKYDIDLAYQVNNETEFFELFPPKCNMENSSEEELEKKFCACANPFTEIKNGKLYNCNWAEFAMEAGLFTEEENDFYDLKNFTPDKKKELVEYRLGYTQKGYVEFCRYCNGSPKINKFKEPAAIQVKGLLEWNRRNANDYRTIGGVCR